jgi:hypothetical protein
MLLSRLCDLESIAVAGFVSSLRNSRLPDGGIQSTLQCAKVALPPRGRVPSLDGKVEAVAFDAGSIEYRRWSCDRAAPASAIAVTR